ncbi:tyrosine-type recombinase/integrase [Cytobacillus oceanisediminis]|uniref:tyrosine-type recombinase/integrase n=1 Tax=Cytobacillus oceanisediminis TaxID=665099 RepID=UPI0035BBBD46|nr:site-specific integrase [Cytobacillus oceanisediminis]
MDTLVRCSKLVGIKRKNIDLKAGFITLGSEKTKAKISMVVPISTKTSKLLKEHLELTDVYGFEFLFLSYEGGTSFIRKYS